MATNTAKCTIVGQAGYDGTKPYTVAGWHSYKSAAMYAGKTNTTANGTKYFPYMLKFKTPDFIGASESLTITYYAVKVSGTDPTLRWALCSSDANKVSYYGTAGAVADTYRLASGKVNHTNISSAKKAFTINISIKTLQPSTTYYLYLWGGDTTTASTLITVSATSNHTVTLAYNAGLVYIDNGGSLEAYQAYIDNGKDWELYMPYIDNGASFEMYSG